ncbi:hypothetical protein [Paraburkholderia sp. C35]|uniref:hypothetical protein n=1 Tax=Paraburkholderia sp. C35 TaxID=2126993 RepID=UPI000D6990A3|nr:hypothetical protein [Paraburkholderia sp. C35]
MADLLRAGRQRARRRMVMQRTYVLQPMRSLAVRLSTWAFVCAACVAAGAAAMHGYAMRAVSASAPCTAPAAPAAHDDTQDALARAQLALRQEAASRASVQKSADALTVEVRQLQAQVLFLQEQGRSRR